MKKFLYLIIILNSFVTLKADTEEPKKPRSLGELSCTIGTAVLFYHAGCSVAGYFHPNINLGLRYTESIMIWGGSGYIPSLLTLLTIYPFKGTFYIDIELGGYYAPPYQGYRSMRDIIYYPEVYGGAFGFHMGNRWIVYKNLFLGINYLGFTYPTDAVLIGFELGYRF